MFQNVEYGSDCTLCSEPHPMHTPWLVLCISKYKNLKIDLFKANMWHDQGEWVTCQQFSILIFQ